MWRMLKVSRKSVSEMSFRYQEAKSASIWSIWQSQMLSQHFHSYIYSSSALSLSVLSVSLVVHIWPLLNWALFYFSLSFLISLPLSSTDSPGGYCSSVKLNYVTRAQVTKWGKIACQVSRVFYSSPLSLFHSFFFSSAPTSNSWLSVYCNCVRDSFLSLHSSFKVSRVLFLSSTFGPWLVSERVSRVQVREREKQKRGITECAIATKAGNSECNKSRGCNKSQCCPLARCCRVRRERERKKVHSWTSLL